VGLHQTAIYLGVIAGGFAGYVADDPALGWRFAFEASGVLGMIYAVPLVLLLRDPPPTDETADSNARSLTRSALELAANVSFLLLVLYFTLPAIAGWVIRDWMPSILKQQFTVSQGKAGVTATVYYQSAAIFGAWFGGCWADAWSRRNARGRIYVSAIGMTVIVPAVFGIGKADSLGAAAAFLVMFGVGWGFFDGNNMPILAQIVRPHLRATAYGIMNFVSINVGGLADWWFGAMRVRGMRLEVIFSMIGAATIVSVFLVLLIKPKAELVQDRSP
jgi:MFS transporter, Spinster family, sphingosine-1-phosphate transporter